MTNTPAPSQPNWIGPALDMADFTPEQQNRIAAWCWEVMTGWTTPAKCPACNGKGCEVCDHEGRIPRHYAEGQVADTTEPDSCKVCHHSTMAHTDEGCHVHPCACVVARDKPATTEPTPEELRELAQEFDDLGHPKLARDSRIVADALEKRAKPIPPLAAPDALEQQIKTIVFDLATRIADMADVAHKNGLGLLVEPDAVRNHVAAIARLTQEARADEIERVERATTRVEVGGGSIKAAIRSYIRTRLAELNVKENMR